MPALLVFVMDSQIVVNSARRLSPFSWQRVKAKGYAEVAAWTGKSKFIGTTYAMTPGWSPTSAPSYVTLRLVIGLKFTIQLGVGITTAAIMVDANSQAPTITIDTNTPNLATAAIQINTNSRANKPNANR